MPRHDTSTPDTSHHATDRLSFEVREVVSLLAAFQARVDATPDDAANADDDYDPFAPGFPRTH